MPLMIYQRVRAVRCRSADVAAASPGPACPVRSRSWAAQRIRQMGCDTRPRACSSSATCVRVTWSSWARWARHCCCCAPLAALERSSQERAADSSMSSTKKGLQAEYSMRRPCPWWSEAAGLVCRACADCRCWALRRAGAAGGGCGGSAEEGSEKAEVLWIARKTQKTAAAC